MTTDKQHMNEACRLARVRGSLMAIADMLPGLLEQAGEHGGLSELFSLLLAEVDADLSVRIADLGGPDVLDRLANEAGYARTRGEQAAAISKIVAECNRSTKAAQP